MINLVGLVIDTPMKLGDLIEIQTESMSFGSAAVARMQTPSGPLVVFVDGAAPHERVRARITKIQKTYLEAELIEILEASKNRVAPECPVFDRCGGCQWQHISYAEQINSKKEILLHQLQRIAKLDIEECKSKLQIHPAENPWGYRSRLQVHGDETGIGFYAKKSHSIVYTDYCPVAHADIQKVWKEFLHKRPLRDLAGERGQFKVEWTRTNTGLVREAINRKHSAFGFSQINYEQNEVLQNLVHRLSGQGETVFDLFGGSGNLSQNLSYKNIVCVDSFNEGKDPTEISTPLSGFQLVRARTEDFLRDQYWKDWQIADPECVIADPPRNGLESAASQVLNLNSPKVILVSCDPSTLARDLTVFKDQYSIREIHLVDMFPQTHHIETVVALYRNAPQNK